MGEESSSVLRERRKRKWDQPDESLIAASIVMPGMFPLTNVGSLVGTLAVNPLTANIIQQAPIMQQQAAAVIRKLTQPQDELVIAREIVINDAEPALRYKLTRRQTQEEIQKSTGAVVITRGKYRPPNAMPDGEKPLYLHISAGAHLKETAEKIIAVDRAAALVEELMKPTSKAFNTSVYLGFDADPSLNIPTRIRGPNDQYINHIMNETGVTVLLRGRGSGNAGSANLEEGEQPLHLFLSSNNPKALEDAKLLADNLLDTISRECGIARVAPVKVYAAIPPPQNLLTGVQCPEIEANSSLCSVAPPASVVSNSSAAIVSSSITPGVSTACTYGAVGAQPGVSSISGQLQPNGICYPQPSLGNGTCYSGYSGIYPQATPLQQVALALRQTRVVPSENSPATSTHISASPSNDKRQPQKRKFQELPTASKGIAVSSKVPEAPDKSLLAKSGHVTVMPPPKKSAGMAPSPPSNFMPPPPPVVNPKYTPPPPPKFISTPSTSRSMPPPPPKFNSIPSNSRSMPPPPPKFNLTDSSNKAGTSSVDDSSKKSKPEIVPDTLVKLMEYGDDDDDDDDPDETGLDSGTVKVDTAPKPFWAI